MHSMHSIGRIETIDRKIERIFPRYDPCNPESIEKIFDWDEWRLLGFREEFILHLSYSIFFEEDTKKQATMKVARDKNQMSSTDSKKRKEPS